MITAIFNIDFIEKDGINLINTAQQQKNTKKNIVLAANAGFCYGVKRAVEFSKKIKAQNPDKNISVLGELIHNSKVISELERLGIKTLQGIPENGDGICIIRSHGESDEVFSKLKKIGFEIVDLTCLDVKKVQSKAVELACNNYFVIILGKKEHPEVKAICANALQSAKNQDNVFVAFDLDELKKAESKIKQAEKIGVVLQTTQTKEFLFDVVDYLCSIEKPNCRILKIENTICPSTSLRQKEARELAQKSDLMIVAGSKKSANTSHLAHICSQYTKTIHIEDVLELVEHIDLIKNSQNIGITAGASTPSDIIDEIIKKLKSIN